MKREQLRLRLARRQNLIAQVGQRTAMRALADALSEEARSEALAVRSRDLLRHYASVTRARDGAGLAQSGQFAAALGNLSVQAEQARADALQQAAWQADALGKASTRADRQKERVEAAYAELQAAKAQRASETPIQARRAQGRNGLARKMQDKRKPDPSRTNDQG